jgi:pimeloyl-ACP methyl ester carboxylesterase
MSALIDAGDLCLNVEQCGSGSSVLLLHGFTGSLETMGTLASALSDSFQVLSVDLPGHGKTRFKSGLGSLTSFHPETGVFKPAVSEWLILF